MSVAFSAGEAVTWCGGKLASGQAATRICGVAIDSRAVTSGGMFVAIAGPNHDGHAFLAQVIEAGVAALLVERGRELPVIPEHVAVIEVADTTLALGALAAGHRRRFDGPVVCITGSNGKTTTKEMCAAILSVGAPTLATRGNLNNNYGLPLTLLSRTPEQRRAVLELGMNHRGEIAELAAIAKPDVAAITNIGSAHIEYLGRRENIAAEKGDLIAALDASGTAVVNAEDDFAGVLAKRAPGRVLRFGTGADADVRAEDVVANDTGFRFTLRLPDARQEVLVLGLGETTIPNALCAATAAYAAGATGEEIITGLANYRGVSGRLERRALPDGVTLIDDSYNANPQSMEVALRLLASSGAGRRIAVLGDMGELGDSANKAHDEAGRLVATLGIDHLIAVGSQAERVAQAAHAGGMPADHIHRAETSDAAGPLVRALAQSGDWILLKGSRSMRMERVGTHLEAEARA
jgi:UDP-N-acetylmuramoyl-tripeptide--D-alanyl-D-alanine ligase